MNNFNSLVSIVVPVYNVEKYIEKCIQSVLNQTYENFELILVNDGSTDNSANICKKYAQMDNRITVFDLKNGGVSRARNYGISKAKGEFIQFLDSDDYLDNDYIYTMISIDNISKVDMVICGIKQITIREDSFNMVNSFVSECKGSYKIEYLSEIFSDLLRHSYINYVYSKLIRRSIIVENNIDFDENVSLGEDTLFILNVLDKCNNIQIVSKAPYNYIIHSPKSLTFKFRKNKFDILNNLNKRLIEFCQNNGIYNKEVQKALSERYFNLIRFCLDENMREDLGISLRCRLNNLKKLLNNDDIIKFINGNNSYQCPKIVLISIRTKNPLIYQLCYYLNIASNKFSKK